MTDDAASWCYTTGQQEDRAVAGSRPSFGGAADRAAAHQFARSLSQKTSVPASPEKQVMLESPFAAADTAADTPSGAGLDRSQQGVGVLVGVPPSIRVRALSRQFSEKTQQSQIARSAAIVCLHACIVVDVLGCRPGGGGRGRGHTGFDGELFLDKRRWKAACWRNTQLMIELAQ